MKTFLLSIGDRDDFQMVATFITHKLAAEFAERQRWDEDFYNIHEFLNHNSSDWDYYDVLQDYDGRTGVEKASYWMNFFDYNDLFVVTHTPGYSYSTTVEAIDEDEARELGITVIESYIRTQNTKDAKGE